jgi:hypothetical protein
MSEKWKNKKLMPGGKVTDDSKDSIKPTKNENAHQTHMDRDLWS